MNIFFECETSGKKSFPKNHNATTLTKFYCSKYLTKKWRTINIFLKNNSIISSSNFLFMLVKFTLKDCLNLSIFLRENFQSIKIQGTIFADCKILEKYFPDKKTYLILEKKHLHIECNHCFLKAALNLCTHHWSNRAF